MRKVFGAFILVAIVTVYIALIVASAGWFVRAKPEPVKYVEVKPESVGVFCTNCHVYKGGIITFGHKVTINRVIALPTDDDAPAKEGGAVTGEYWWAGPVTRINKEIGNVR